jgi:hypothetical protein
MRVVQPLTYALAVSVLLAPLLIAQETARSVTGGGITASGWTGKIDPNEERAGQKLENAKLAQEGAALHVTTGRGDPLESRDKATGDYGQSHVQRPKYMNLNNFPLRTGSSSPATAWGRLGRATSTAAYGNGNFIVRGFGGRVSMNGGGARRAAVHGQPVTRKSRCPSRWQGRMRDQRHGGRQHDKAELVTAGKLKSTDGVYGSAAHNTDGTVTTRDDGRRVAQG